MSSSTGQTSPSSPAVANAAPPPATTMEPKMDAGLLALVCSGSFHDLESLLNGKAAAYTIGSSATQPPSLYAVTVGGDTLLHVVAAIYGDSEDSTNKASLVYDKAPSLLFVQNSQGDTPLHCAARAGNIRMVSLLVDLVKGQGVNNAKGLLETQNKIHETALHEAVRSGKNDMVKLFMEENPQLASFPKDGTSPLYLSVLLENKIIAETLYKLSDGVLSYHGPNGQNALHVAVQRSQDLTEMLLEWNNDLTLRGDENESTPLHFAIVAIRWLSKGDRQLICSQVLEANPDALYQPNHNGSFPIHVAASVGATWAITDFIMKSPNCAGLRDARGRTFLHVAVDKMNIWTVRFACSNRSLSWILNMQDKDGNTALHLAVQAESVRMFCSLFGNRLVNLNLANKKGQTPLNIAYHNIPKGLSYSQNSGQKILHALKYVDAKMGIRRRGYLKENDIDQARQDEIQQMDRMKEGTQSLCIGAVLIATVTFGASFTIPGGYRADDHTNGGTPTLAGRYAFDVFTVANALAFASSAMATISLMYSGSPMVHFRSRKMHIAMAYSLMWFSLANVAAAFALGAYAMLAPVAHKTAITVCVLSSVVLVYDNLELATQNSVLITARYRRKGIRCEIVWTFPLAALAFVCTILVNLWPMVIMFCLTALSHTGSKVELAAQPPTPLA